MAVSKRMKVSLYHARGFTLMELTMVIAITGIVALVAIPRTPTGLGVRPQAEQLKADLRYAQLLSMSNGQRYCVRFIGNSYSITTASSSCVTAIIHPAGLTQPITLQDATLSVAGLPNSYVAFDARGAPYVSTGASPTALSSTASLTLSGSGTTAALSLAPITGLVTGP